jgi:hypothetical protein
MPGKPSTLRLRHNAFRENLVNQVGRGLVVPVRSMPSMGYYGITRSRHLAGEGRNDAD